MAIALLGFELFFLLKGPYTANLPSAPNPGTRKSDAKKYWLEVYKSKKSIEEHCEKLGYTSLSYLEAQMETLDFTLADLQTNATNLDPLPTKKFFIVILLHSSEGSAPTLFFEIIKLAALLQQAPGDPSNLFISVMLSGFHDATGLEVIGFQRHLRFLGIAHAIKYENPPHMEEDPDLPLGHWERNKALQPLYESEILYDQVVFFHDQVLVCASAVIEMLLSGFESDMACSGDHHVTPSTNTVLFSKTFRNVDITGNLFTAEEPYVRDEMSRAHHIKGNPYHVFSCWGGVVVIKAHVFQKHDLRFRSAMPLECDETETQLFARDLWALGTNRISLHPLIYTTYQHSNLIRLVEERALMAPDPNHMIGWSYTRPKVVQCCPQSLSKYDYPECLRDYVWWWYDINGIPKAKQPHDTEIAPPDPAEQRLTIDLISRAVQFKSSLCINYERPKTGIPERIVQIWRTDNLYDMPLAVLFGLMSWIHVNPCHEIVVLSSAALMQFVAEHHTDMYGLFSQMRSLQQRMHLGSYLYMNAYGGVHASPGTFSVLPLKQLITPNDQLVVGAEADFWDDTLFARWGYPYQTTLTTACWATVANNPVISKVIQKVRANLLTSPEIYSIMRTHKAGRTSFLETMWTTGSGPFTEVILIHASENPAIRVFGVFEFRSFQPEPTFLGMMSERSKALQVTYVEIFDFQAWRKWGDDWRRLDKLISPTELQVGGVLIDGDYMLGLQQQIEETMALWETPRDFSLFPYNSEAPAFLWLRSSHLRHSDQGCVEIFRGRGPKDDLKQLSWRACWSKQRELDVVYLTLEENRQLAVKTTLDLSCDTNSSRALSYANTTVTLWSSKQITEHHMTDSAFVTSFGQLTIGQRDVSASNLQTTMLRVVHGVRGYCHEQYAHRIITVRSLDHAIALCMSDSECFSFALRLNKDKVTGKMFMCRVPMRSQSSKFRRWVMGTKLPGSNSERWIRVEGVQLTCDPEDLLDRTGRDSVATLEEAEILCSLDAKCSTVMFKADPASQDEPEVWLCKQQLTLENALYNPLYHASLRVWDVLGQQSTESLLCSSVWFDQEVCGAFSNGLDSGMVKSFMCWDQETRKI